MSKVRITPDFFHDIKKFNRWHTNKRTADKFGIHLSTVINIRGSQTYIQYKQLVAAEHTPVKYSLRDDILELHKLTFNKQDNKYITPPTAKIAVQELLLKA